MGRALSLSEADKVVAVAINTIHNKEPLTHLHEVPNIFLLVHISLPVGDMLDVVRNGFADSIAILFSLISMQEILMNFKARATKNHEKTTALGSSPKQNGEIIHN